MLTRRIATFLIGAWVGCGLLIGVVLLQNTRWARVLTADPTDPAKILLIKIGEEDAQLLLEHSAAEHSRAFTSGWETTQIVLGIVMLVVLGLSPQRRFLPIALVAAMLILVLIQHFGFTPEITYRGRDADFLPDESAFSTRTRLNSLTQLYIATEALKLLIGGLLASYLFVANSGKKVKRTTRTSISSHEPIS